MDACSRVTRAKRAKLAATDEQGEGAAKTAKPDATPSARIKNEQRNYDEDEATPVVTPSVVRSARVKKEEEEEEEATTTLPRPMKVPSSTQGVDVLCLDQFLEQLSPQTQIFRIREFIGHNHRSHTDPYARKASLFALINGCVFKTNNYLPSPAFQAGNEYDCSILDKGMFGKEDSSVFNKPHGFKTATWNVDYMMATMPAGSIVAMIIPNKTGQHDVCFGIVHSNSFRVEHHSNLDGFPFNHSCGERNLLCRTVSWCCTVKLRNLPGQELTRKGVLQAKWLHECNATCLMEVKNNDNNYYKTRALDS